MQVLGSKDLSYRSLREAFKTVYMREGFKGLYKGITPALIASTGSWAGYFYLYESIKVRRLKYNDNSTKKLSTIDHVSFSLYNKLF